MKFNNFLKSFNSLHRICYSTTKLKIIPDEDVLKGIENNEYRPRTHPGISKVKTVALPPQILTSILKVCKDFPIKSIQKESEKLCRSLKNRVPQIERIALDDLRQNIHTTIYESERAKKDILTDLDEQKLRRSVDDKVVNILKKKVYHWEPMVYDEYKSLVYLLGRAAPEYSVLVRILAEIKARDANFTPRGLFDFGSGIGTVTWAVAHHWQNKLFETFNVDVSSFMNDLAESILQKCRGLFKESRGIFYRQFLPANTNTYDLVVSAYSLMELPSAEIRMDTILRLWNKTEKYLVIVENGTNGGFRIINECRDFILQLDSSKNNVHVFSPCPHDHPCPRFGDGTPCNFTSKYQVLDFEGSGAVDKELYSYVVLKKGARSSTDTQWPRVVRETLVRSKHCICRVCTAQGQLAEPIFSASKVGKYVP